MERIKEFIAENRFMLLVSLLLLVLICWLHADSKRNEPIYHNTDNTVAELEKRIESAEQRLATMQKRLDETQKAVNGIAVGISRSTGYAIEVNEGIGRAETRLDSAIQRSQRIEEIISDVENANR